MVSGDVLVFGPDAGGDPEVLLELVLFVVDEFERDESKIGEPARESWLGKESGLRH